MSLRDALRADWIRTNTLTEEQLEILSQQHPDERAVRCPNELFVLPQDVEYRHGGGYVLGDGAWYDPVMETFHYFETVYEPTGEIRFDLGTEYQY
jgi:hypothetical protein